MTTYTEMEKKVFNALIDICYDEPEADMHDLHVATGISIPSLKGVVGSLVKKEVVDSSLEERGGRNFVSINPIIDGEVYGFGCDKYSEDEVEEYKLKSPSYRRIKMTVEEENGLMANLLRHLKVVAGQNTHELISGEKEYKLTEKQYNNIVNVLEQIGASDE